MGCPTTVVPNLERQECQQLLQGDPRCTRSGSLEKSEWRTRGKLSPLAPARCSAPPLWPPICLVTTLMQGSNWSCSKLRVRRCPFASLLAVARHCSLMRETTRGKCQNSWSHSGSCEGSNRRPEDCLTWTETGTRLSQASSCGCWPGWRGIPSALQPGGFLSRMALLCDPECGLRLDE